ncbi:MAG TPA: hypothetical protein EYG39_05240 [Rhodothermales bacterium]|nr:hypothetical protein [Rhodothermales bacterium]
MSTGVTLGVTLRLWDCREPALATSQAGFDPDFYEFQQEFFFSVIAPFISAAEMPLTGGIVNPEKQRDDVPDRLQIGPDVRPHAGTVVPDHEPGGDGA